MFAMPKVKINIKDTYCIVSAFADDIVDFTEAIQSLLNDGWKTAGGLSAANSMLYQALIKNEK
jgi:hypothetical protein